MHAVVATALSVATFLELPWAALWPPSDASDVARGAIWVSTTPAASLAAAVTYGYIALDTVLGIAFPGLLDRAMAIHHIIVLVTMGLAQLHTVGEAVELCLARRVGHSPTTPL